MHRLTETYENNITERWQDKLDALVLKEGLAPFLALIKAARNGAVYGAKVRFPHALV
jgi:hypothetical protein